MAFYISGLTALYAYTEGHVPVSPCRLTLTGEEWIKMPVVHGHGQFHIISLLWIQIASIYCLSGCTNKVTGPV